MQTSQQIKEEIKKMSQKIREVAFSPELFEIIDKISAKNNFTVIQSRSFSDLIFNALVNITDETYLRSNISYCLGDDSTLNKKVLGEVEQEIFKNLDNLYEEILKNNTESTNPETNIENQETKKTDIQNGVGNSFEQIILNQAKAMRPIRAEGEVPHNLPTEEQNNGVNRKPDQETKGAIHNYIGNDPYREPIG